MNLFSRSCLVTILVPLGLFAQSVPEKPPCELLSGLDPFKANRFDVPPTQAKFVRLEVAGDNNQPCIDELEIFGTAPDKNLALASNGAKVTASSCLTGYPDSHRIEFLNDGLYGNEHSWIPAETPGWITLELPSVTTVASIVLSRDRERKLSDRGLASFSIKTSLDGQRWTLLKQVRVLNASTVMNGFLMTFDPKALRNAAKAMTDKHPGFKLPDSFEKRLAAYEQGLQSVLDGLAKEPASESFRKATQLSAEMQAFQREVLLTNPDIDFDQLLLIRRKAAPQSLVKRGYHDNLGLPVNFCGNSCINPVGWDNEIATLSLRGGKWKTLYRPKEPAIVSEFDLHFSAKKILFASAGGDNRWQVFEIGTDGSGLRQVTPSSLGDVDNYDPMYLPDGRIVFNSSASFAGVPCFGGTDYVANLHLMNADGTGVRRLTYEQDNNWHPTMLPNGRVLYLRWEYTDTAHYFSRILMQMNPDGTGQMALYGSNSYWPNTMFFAKPLPGSSSKFVAIVSGHHGTCRAGELYLFDANKGRHETSGVIQRIAPALATPATLGTIKDSLVNHVWPKFLHPYPLSDQLFLVSCQLSPKSPWGIYLVDTFNNLTLIAESQEESFFEPVPFKPQPMPPVIPDKVDLKRKDASVSIQNIYEGPGLRNVPRGAVKALRVFQYEYAYRDMGGHYRVGMEGPWDVRRLLGTVPVLADGSASFNIPANTPVALQPLDAEGKALQLMRSWFVGMPGEKISCVGCHESQTQVLLPSKTLANASKPSEITPWHGPVRGFSFLREVQPVLNRYCVSCHDGSKPGRPDFKNTEIVGKDGHLAGFAQSYMALHPFVRRNGPEGVYYLLTPLEFHADTSELIQLLRKGHHGVKLEPEAWDRLITWIDLNVPCHGAWSETQRIPGNFVQRRKELKKQYSGLDEDVEAIVFGDKYDETPVIPKQQQEGPYLNVTAKDWPMSPDVASKKQESLEKTSLKLDIGNGQQLTFVRIPAGAFVMGSMDGASDERPMTSVTMDKPFWICTTEITLSQFQLFDAAHRNGFYDQHYKDQVRPGYDMDKPDYPAIRVSWSQSMAFCAWLSAKSGRKVTLPTEAQWEYACRAGSASAMSYGSVTNDFARFANLADVQLKKMAVIGVDPQPVKNPNKYWDYLPKIASVDDGHMLLASVASYQPNAWKLFDMHGNVAEWCLDTYRPYPYVPNSKDSSDTGPSVRKVIRGGSWNDRPHRATSSFRLDFPCWQQIYNVGFRPVIIEE
jgi:formylglycine-generating enzyme required for sulfatase activity